MDITSGGLTFTQMLGVMALLAVAGYLSLWAAYLLKFLRTDLSAAGAVKAARAVHGNMGRALSAFGAIVIASLVAMVPALLLFRIVQYGMKALFSLEIPGDRQTFIHALPAALVLAAAAAAVWTALRDPSAAGKR